MAESILPAAAGARIPIRNIGNANAAQATQFTTVDSIPANTNIEAVADIADMGLYPRVKLNNQFLYTHLEEIDPTTFNVGTGATSTVTFQFTLSSWTYTTDMTLELPVTISATTRANYNAATAGNKGVDPLLINNAAAANEAAFLLTTPTNQWWSAAATDNANVAPSRPGLAFSKGFYPNRAVLQLIKSAQIYGGTNNQPLGRTPMMDFPNLSTIPDIDRVGNEDGAIIGVIGAPLSNICLDAPGTGWNVDNAFPIGTPITYSDGRTNTSHRCNDEQMTAFESVVRMASVANGATGVYAAAGNTTTYTNSFVLSLRMGLISEFFKKNKALPPEFKFKITLVFQNNPIVMYKGLQKVRGSGDTAFRFVDSDFTLAINTALRPQIKLKGLVLNAPVQNQLNLLWTNNVFTYSIETADPYVIPSTSFPYQQVIQTSSQRPFLLKIVVQAIRGASRTFALDGADVTTAFYQEGQSMPWVDVNLAPVKITELKVFISGKTLFQYTNYTQGNGDLIATGFETIINTWNRRNFRKYNELPGDFERQIKGTIISGTSGFPIDIPITPGAVVDNANYPMDQGSVQIKLYIKTSAQLHPNTQITVYKILPQQISVDANNKVSLTEWPAMVVQEGRGSVLKQPTVVPAN